MSILIYKQRHRHPNYKKTPKGNYAHIGYIATRPGAVKNEGMRHGLFGKLFRNLLYHLIIRFAYNCQAGAGGGQRV